MPENHAHAETVDFHGNELITVLYGNAEYVAMKPIVEGMGLSWQGEQDNIRTSQNYQAIRMALETGDGVREMLCMPLIQLNRWLFSIRRETVRPETRFTVAVYQDECLMVLHNHWHRVPKECQQMTVASLMSEVQAAATLHEILRREDEQTKQFINDIIKAIYDIDCLSLWSGVSYDTADDVPRAKYGKKMPSDDHPPTHDKEEVYLTPTELGSRLGLSAQKTNRLLEKLGIIESYRNNQDHLRWRPTEKGRPYVIPDHIRRKPNGSRRQCLMFSESVMEAVSCKL